MRKAWLMTTQQKSWWQEPMMWLVVGGPAVVVVAGLLTVWIAMRGADHVLPREQQMATQAADLPAKLGRNHVADPSKAMR